jgi:hypothetical protein
MGLPHVLYPPMVYDHNNLPFRICQQIVFADFYGNTWLVSFQAPCHISCPSPPPLFVFFCPGHKLPRNPGHTISIA